MSRNQDGSIFISKGTPMPYLCPECDAIVPCTAENFGGATQRCVMCDYEGPTEEFDVEWEFSPMKVV